MWTNDFCDSGYGGKNVGKRLFSRWVEIEHVKLNCEALKLGPALLEAHDSETSMVRLRRVFKWEGIYDGLTVIKEPDDYGVTDLRLVD